MVSSIFLTMDGQMRLKPGGGLMPMRAVQVLAPQRGLIWQARVGWPLLWMSGFDLYHDGHGEMNWRLYGLVRFVRAQGVDIDRAAAGRVAGESIFVPTSLVPTTLSPERAVRWEHIDEDTTKAIITLHGGTTPVTLTVDGDGRLRRAAFPRWREGAAGRAPGYATFAVDLDEERRFAGNTIPTRMTAGWLGAGGEEFRFFFATIRSAEYR